MRGRPLHHQILAVNAALVITAVLAAIVAARLDFSEVAESRQFMVLIAAILATVLVNGVVLRRRFAPLGELIETMERVDLTNPGVRTVPLSADSADVIRLREAFNRMLARLEEERVSGASAVLRAQEAERGRLARDLHDEANQALTGVLLRLQASTHRAPPELAAELRETQEACNQAMQELLRLARELRPTALDDHGLEAALRTQVERFGHEAGVTATLDLAAGLDDAMDTDGQLVTYRVVQESLSNVVQHAQASSVHVEVRRRDGRAVVRIIDDGQGIGQRCASGFGLAGMRERALLAGGTLTVMSAPGRGTTVELVIGESRPSVAPPLPARRPIVVEALAG
ncbi:MAG: sensor histidine kinase [Solirubrobacterales bacterium]|nr:sensor histidine kinase [Solirubrobacterales bacterium]